jgi:hypothetical protein
MAQSPSWEANNRYSDSKISRLLCNSKFHYSVHSSPPLAPILSQMHPIHTYPTSLRSILILSSHLLLGRGPTQPPIQWEPGALSMGVKRPGREADHSSSSSAEVKECVALYLQSPNKPSWRGARLKKAQGQLYLLHMHKINPVSITSYVRVFFQVYVCKSLSCKSHENVLFCAAGVWFASPISETQTDVKVSPWNRSS